VEGVTSPSHRSGDGLRGASMLTMRADVRSLVSPKIHSIVSPSSTVTVSTVFTPGFPPVALATHAIPAKFESTFKLSGFEV